MDERRKRAVLEEARRLASGPRYALDPDTVAAPELRRSEPIERVDHRPTDAENARTAAAAWAAHLQREIGAAIQSEHTFMIQVIGEVVAHERTEFERLLEDQKRAAEADLKMKLAEMRLDLTNQMASTIEAMQRCLRGNRKAADEAGHDGDGVVLDMRKVN